MDERLKIIISANVDSLKKGCQDAVKGIKNMESESTKMGNNSSKAFEKVGGAAQKAGQMISKVLVVGIGAAASAVAALSTAAVKSYAEYEQLTGGIETLFKGSSDSVMKYAQNAYKTAGLSANEYMETVTSFSASLLQSLGGDTEKAASQADKAITDMADNANKMGTSIESIQNAYQGFAKQNYTMLDNLKLGYGGTKAEMERLLRDAEAISGIKYDISSYSDVVDAIHVIQTEMGITGTTALEASNTISGSLASMKSAWGNLVTGIADDNADFQGLIDNFVESVGIAAGNILPRFEVALNGVGQLIDSLFPIIVEKIPDILNSVLPKLLESGTNIIITLATGFSDSMPSLIQTVVDTIPTIMESLSEVIPLLIDSGIDIVVAIINGLSETAPDIIAKIIELIPQIATALINGAPQILDAAIRLFGSLVSGLFNSIPELIKGIGTIVSEVKNKLIEKLKGLMKFNWSLPKLKLPSVSITGKFSLSPLQVPKFSLKWNAKGGVFDKPTIFSYGNSLQGLGEDGAEAVVPLEKNTEWLDKIAEKLASRTGNTPIILQVDGKTFAKTSIETINQLTRQSGKLELNIY